MVEIKENGLNDVIHFNFDKMYTYLGQDRESIRKTLLAVLDELKITISKFDECMINRRFIEIRTTANRLVRITASVGLDRLCETLQKIAQSNRFDPIALDRNFNVLKKEISLVNKLVNRYLLEE